MGIATPSAAAPQGEEKISHEGGRLDLKNKASNLMANLFEKLESFGISRKMALDIFEGFFGDKKTGIMATLFLPFYEKERAKDLKKDFDAVLKKDKYDFTDKEMVTIYESWKKDENFKTKTFSAYLTHLKKNAQGNKAEGEPWNIKNIDVSGELQKEQLQKLRQEVERDIMVMGADFDALIEGAATGEYDETSIKTAIEISVNKRGEILTEDQKKSLVETIIGKAIGKDLVKTACLNALRMKIHPESAVKVPNKNTLIVSNLGTLSGNITCEYGSGHWNITHKRETVTLNDNNQLEFFLRELGKGKNKDAKKIKGYLENPAGDFLTAIGVSMKAEVSPSSTSETTDTPQAPQTSSKAQQPSSAKNK